MVGIRPTPDRAFVSGSKNPISPRPGKGSFLSKNPLFSTRGTHGKWGSFDRKLPFPARVRAKGKWGVFGTPKPSFPGNGDSGPCLLETNLASRWEGVRLPRASGKSPGLPRKFPKLPRRFFGDFPGSSQQSRGSPEVSQTSPEVPRTSPEVPRTSPEVSPFLWEA